jgi:streptogramin lyase
MKWSFLTSAAGALLALTLLGAFPAGAETGSISETGVPTANSQPLSIVTGPDGNLWFTEFRGNKIGRLAPDGTVLAEYPIPTTVPPTAANPTGSSQPDEIDVGPDGNLWFAEVLGNRIGRITPNGVITEFLVPTAGSRPTVIAPGPDGNLWFTERGTAAAPGNKIGRITPSGTITEFLLPAGSRPLGITAGPDGNVWFSLSAANKVGRIDPQSEAIVLFDVPTAGALPFEMTGGPDGNVWFTEPLANQVARVRPDGVITEFPLPGPGRGPNTIRRGPDPNGAKDCAYQRQALGESVFVQRYGTFGNCVARLATTQTLWFTETQGNAIGQITTAGVVFEYAIPTPASAPIGVAEGPDGALWFAENGANKIGRLDVQSVRQPARPGVPAD